MTKSLAIASIALLLSACASGPVRPLSGPGSGSGASYVPVIQPAPAPTPAFDALVEKCQHEAAGLPFMKTEDHDAALWVVDTAVALGAGYAAFAAVGGAQQVNYVSGAIVGGTTFIGMRSLFDTWVYSPQIAVWHQKQESQVANCMARSGYTNADPTVVVTWTSYAADRVPLRATGKDTYTAEKLAKASACAAIPVAKLVSRGPGYENHSVVCSNGTVMVIDCEFGNCRRIVERVATS